jgi:hypothetical protein
MKWDGINRKITDIGAPDGTSFYQANTRMRVEGELQRRQGYSKSSLTSAGVPILGLSATMTPNGVIVMGAVSGGANGDGPTVTEKWTEKVIHLPKGQRAAHWTTFHSGVGNSSPIDFLPALASPGTLALSSSSSGRSLDGTQFAVYFDGVLSYNSACIQDAGVNVSVPANTGSIQVVVTVSCLGGGGVSWFISGSG